MSRKNKGSDSVGKIILIIIGIYFIFNVIPNIFNNISFNKNDDKNKVSEKYFRIISSTSTSKMDESIIKYGKKNGIKVHIDHYGDLEIVDMLNNNSSDYDAVWISNSLWLYMLDNQYLTTDSKSIVIDPVVMGIEKSKAKELGFEG